MRVLVCECIHEVSSFNPIPTRYDDFAVASGEQMFASHRGAGSEVGGALHILDDSPEIVTVPGYSARGITSGGTIPSADFRRLAGEFLDTLRQAGPVDGVYFALHGAMAASDEEDPEGFLLAEARKILGERIPIVASFDLHGILTDRMLEHTDAIVVYHTYPHVDFFETGQRAARLLLRLLRKEVRPVTARVAIPALVRGDELITQTGFFGKVVGEAQKIERGPGGLSAGFFIGNPFTDVPDLCSNTVVVTDGTPDRAASEALRLAEEFWSHRERMQAKLTGLEESLRIAAATTGTVVLVDAADATSSGAPGDSNAILREARRIGYRGRVLAPIVDPEAVQAAFAVGVGGTVRTRIGGAFDTRRHVPLEVEAQVRMLSDGHFRSESFKRPWFGGRTAVLQADNVTLVATSRPVHLYDRSLFLAHGQDPREFDLVVVKSPHCEPHMFADWCALLINVDAPGATSANLPSLGHTRCRRPIFPLDRDVQFAPRVRLFSRHSGIMEIEAELLSAESSTAGKIVSAEEMGAWQIKYRRKSRRVVFTNGCFDLLHTGHVQYLQAAAALGAVLVVALNSDASVRRLKGPERPILKQQDRAALVAALACVHHVLIFEEDTPESLLRLIRPEVLVKGGDYALEGVVGRELVEQYGGKVCVTDKIEGISTSGILANLKGRQVGKDP